MRVHKWVPAAAVWLLAIGGCAEQQRSAFIPAPIAIAPAYSTVAPPAPNTFVPSGTEFTVILNDEVGSASSIPGQSFTGQLEQAIRAADGSVFAPAGATVRGKVDRVNYATRPSLRLDFETVETPSGPAVLETTLRDANGYAAVVPSDPAETPEGAPDTILYPPINPVPTAIGGGPRSGRESQPSPGLATVLLPRGTAVRLVLKHPLLAPDFSAQYGE